MNWFNVINTLMSKYLVLRISLTPNFLPLEPTIQTTQNINKTKTTTHQPEIIVKYIPVLRLKASSSYKVCGKGEWEKKICEQSNKKSSSWTRTSSLYLTSVGLIPPDPTAPGRDSPQLFRSRPLSFSCGLCTP